MIYEVIYPLLVLIEKLAFLRVYYILNLVNNLSPLGLWQLKTVLSRRMPEVQKYFLEDV